MAQTPLVTVFEVDLPQCRGCPFTDGVSSQVVLIFFSVLAVFWLSKGSGRQERSVPDHLENKYAAAYSDTNKSVSPPSTRM